MHKRILYTIIISMLFALSANASDRVHVSSMEEFDTIHPKSTIDVKVLSPAIIGENSLEENDIIHCNVIKITKPKRGKRSASFTVEPTSYTRGEITNPINGDFYGKYAEKVLSKEELKNIDAKQAGKKAAKTVGNHFIKGIAPVASLAEGMIKNEEGNRIESGVKQVYKDSPLSYIEKGQALSIEPGKQFYLIFKSTNSDNDYEYDESSEE